MVQKIQSYCKQASLYMFISLLAYMPLHIFLSTWLGTASNLLDFAKIAKDIVLLIGVIAALAASINTAWLLALFKKKIVWLIAAYAALTVVLAALFSTDQDAEVLGLVYNLRFFVMFGYATLLANLFDLRLLRRRTVMTVVAVGVLVSFIGVMQYLVLPDDVLRHVGYSRENGVLPAFFIDDKPDLERVMSTLRDPNSLGSYLIIIGSLIGGIWLKVKNQHLRMLLAGSGILTTLCLLFTFSRSAWLGAMVAGGTFGVLYSLHKKSPMPWLRSHKKIVVVAAAGFIICAGGVFAARGSYLVQNVVFHADEATVLEDPNELRMRFWSESVTSTLEQPLGHGPGTAGLASIRNDKQGTVLNENYYLQIVYEVGVPGLLLFLTIVVLMAYSLYQTFRTEDDLVAAALLASFAGLLITNFLVHIWSNEAVAHTFWGLAGLYALSPKTKLKASDQLQKSKK